MAFPDWDLMTPPITKPFLIQNGPVKYRQITGTLRDEGPLGPAILYPRRPSTPGDLVFRADHPINLISQG